MRPFPQTLIELLQSQPNAATFIDVQGTLVVPNLLDGTITFLDFIRGDANQSGRVDISDAITILEHLFLGGELVCEDFGDANDSGRLDISDAIYLLSFLFLGGPAIPAPFPEKGEDPTEDELACPGSPP